MFQNLLIFTTFGKNGIDRRVDFVVFPVVDGDYYCCYYYDFFFFYYY